MWIGLMQDEYEIVTHALMKHVNLFVTETDYRNAHLHQDFELNLILSGELSLLTNTTTDTFRPGTLILLNPNVVHEIQAGKGGTYVLCLQWSPKFLHQLIPELGSLSFDEMILQNTLSETLTDSIRALIVEIAYQGFLREPAWQLLCNSLFSRLIFLLLRHVPFHTLTADAKESIRKRVERLGRIVAYVDEHYMHKLSLTAIAEQEGVTAGYLSHFIRNNFNQSFQDYVNNVRLRHAKILLQTDRRLLDICLEVGFSDPRYLRKQLLQREGCTPEEYRKRHDAGDALVRQSKHISENTLSATQALKVLEAHRRGGRKPGDVMFQ